MTDTAARIPSTSIHLPSLPAYRRNLSSDPSTSPLLLLCCSRCSMCVVLENQHTQVDIYVAQRLLAQSSSLSCWLVSSSMYSQSDVDTTATVLSG